ncbi:carbohydrate ABC transporter permease [Micromonospora cathayae]|uniref:Sugar ABC transporter permease n=1 Tax=Micromonospora cathayae TaxID=3028804 RepID=A0ABY7ZNZ2_9ACTN|nr:sugar ABC transporter permease [Micromonospora sp. HUAS 3]WDZ83783.1 sugar ABC transporter permease [Micromonospora sp. HUAS 3]
MSTVPVPTQAKPERAPTRSGVRRGALAMLIPVVLLALVLGVYPIGRGIWLGFTNERTGGVYGVARTRFVGLDNFVSIFGDAAFVQGLTLMLVIAAVVVVTTYTLAYLQAMLLNQEFPFRRVVRTIVLLPMAVAPVVVGQVFRYLYDPSTGSVNGLLTSLGLVREPEFLPSSSLKWFWIAIPAVWMALPVATLFLLAAIQNVPDELLEAATLDGAGPLGRFRYVTFPATRGALAAILPLSFAAQMLAFELFFALFGGQLGSVSSAGLLVPSVYGYYDLTRGLPGRAAATGTVILAVILIAFLVSRYISLREERKG